jgi:hypothetical protein
MTGAKIRINFEYRNLFNEKSSNNNYYGKNLTKNDTKGTKRAKKRGLSGPLGCRALPSRR